MAKEYAKDIGFHEWRRNKYGATAPPRTVLITAGLSDAYVALLRAAESVEVLAVQVRAVRIAGGGT